jgi:hypothetical protein
VNLRAVALIVPVVALIVIAVLFRSAPGVVHFALIGGFAYVAIVALSLVRRAWSRQPRSRFRQAQTRPPRQNLLSSLDELESAIRLARSAGLQYDHRLRPTLSRIALRRLEARGISWEREPERVEELFGARTWQLIQPLGGFPDRDAPGVPLAAIEEIVSRIEEV